MFFLRYNSPRWLIFVIDSFLCVCSIILAYFLRFNFNLPAKDSQALNYVVIFVLLVRAISFLIGKTYAGVIRYTSTKDAQRIFFALFAGSAFFWIANITSFAYNSVFVIPRSIIIIDFMASFLSLVAVRLVVKILYHELTNPNKNKQVIAIIGADERAVITKRTLDRDTRINYSTVALFDDINSLINKKIEGTTIYDLSKFEDVIGSLKVESLIIAKSSLKSTRKKEIVEACLLHNIKVLNVPPVERWINGELSVQQIKSVKIEELLERDPIELDTKLINKTIIGKKVLITGAAGSIGSEIVRQILPFNPKQIILFDQAESPLYDLELELNDLVKELQSQIPGIKTDIQIVLGDIRKRRRMRYVFETYKPDLVYHAAAYKHVPLVENNPLESILVNVMGTKIVADLSHAFKVQKFIMVSTDKAVNPTNVMGASKRVAEIYIQSLNKISETRFITTRFGNVLGSNGSVIPLFKKQIENGGPITVTHPEITRYFMTIPEACLLVLEASAFGEGGEIFVFDMGNSVKIIDLAKKMIKLSGLTLDRDIKIIYSGLRPGEKLYEELLNDEENVLPTHYQRILRAKVREYDFEVISKQIDELIGLFEYQDDMLTVKKLKDIVPEFISQNSIYQQLD